ncbi:hypothetical protein MPSEU_000706800 [Mayamaea pseudoterrestris]|nr:hypothetical protein MPSEU_000706800 [Mayamaea pseudoterrestris]
MSLIGLALIGRTNEPIYLCDCARIVRDKDLELSQAVDETASSSATKAVSQHSSDDSVGVNDPFGIAALTRDAGMRESLGFEHRLMIHSALDQLEESVNTTSVGLPVLARNAGAGGFLGVLSRIDEDKSVFGYITATNIKLLLLTESSAKEADIRTLLSDVHELYVRYCLNPLRDMNSDISSKEFDKRISQTVRLYESKRKFN